MICNFRRLAYELLWSLGSDGAAFGPTSGGNYGIELVYFTLFVLLSIFHLILALFLAKSLLGRIILVLHSTNLDEKYRLGVYPVNPKGQSRVKERW